ncbi:protein STPG4 isoform X1 [Macaca thibetana thibetana]|uniref:protein STPG4 isoform X1 n=1 Tax=Macaca thibetana thibetana TaxID=257877 RepID=UPI0021BC58FD|nr:protein STPG4 isoform X1 [Macaca thibetana thibetana]XP_050610847.1 protein STPG4 isoform X1 [Macaca thibetana thibetana]XP_050610848.1 protein STPG4 isoform X1 [Macaca thibetana thibetana]
MDQPAVATASTTLREDLVRGESFITASKPARKTSSFEREGWWRIALTNTPIPGTYHLKTFIEESLLNPVIATYNFKNEGRKKPPLVQRNNPVLNDLPQYMPPGFLDLLKKQAATYSFKDKPRPSPSTLVDKDQSLQLSPGQYNVLPAPVPKYASRSRVFRSTVQRFPTTYFIPGWDFTMLARLVSNSGPQVICPPQPPKVLGLQHEGPGPGDYNVKIPPTSSITSCFQSRVPRFLPSRSKTPGPGAYTTLRQFPKQSPTIAKMGREHSLFFNNTIGF